MSPDNKIRLEIEQLKNHRCFACGTENPIGLKLKFWLEADTIGSTFALDLRHTGWEGMAHGGIISTVLDEVMGWSVVAFRRRFFVTRTLTVRYLRPVPLGETLEAKGRVVETQENGCRTEGELLDSTGHVLATGQAEMTDLSQSRIETMPAFLRRDMEQIFAMLEESIKSV